MFCLWCFVSWKKTLYLSYNWLFGSEFRHNLIKLALVMQFVDCCCYGGRTEARGQYIRLKASQYSPQISTKRQETSTDVYKQLQYLNTENPTSDTCLHQEDFYSSKATETSRHMPAGLFKVVRYLNSSCLWKKTIPV